MDNTATSFETLKEILRHARNPEQLDGHPWTESLFVREALQADPDLQGVSPGGQLIGALAALFRALQPASPPRQGLRLDPRWGEFGLLAALYFAPFNHGTPFPSSQLEAWGRIDPAILFFVYGKPAEALEGLEVEKYRLVGDELEFGSASTLSDWHRKGVQRLEAAVLNRERYLARSNGRPSPLLGTDQEGALAPGAEARSGRRPAWKRAILAALVVLFLVGLGLGAFKGWRIYERGRLVYAQVMRARTVLQTRPGLDDLRKAGPILQDLQRDWEAFREETRPLLWLGPALRWLPVHGGDLASAPELAALVDHLIAASCSGYEAAQPILAAFEGSQAGLKPAELTNLLVQAQPGLDQTRTALDQALAMRESLQDERLSPRLRTLLTGELDPLLELADQGLSLATSMPAVLGATPEGPKTYLLLVQNEDELRPTGGFITTVGKLVLHNGQIISLEFEGVDSEQEDWSKPYPLAPWQLQEYMNSRVLILRDANWFTDYPTTVAWVEYLYAYKHSHSVDGVIAFDQQFLVLLLRELGPLDIEGVPYALTADNVTGYMRAAKVPPAGELRPADWYRKEFIEQIAQALLEKVSAGEGINWRALASLLAQALAERHLLLQFDDPQLAALLADHDWDNTLRPGTGDFLMVVDTNIGFNKTSANIAASFAYDVDLTDVTAPTATLVITHENTSSRDVQCIHWDTERVNGTSDSWYPTNRCYWDYLRVYKQAGAELQESSPHTIPGEQLLLGHGVPARVDELEEEIPGIRGFGTLLVVPGGAAWNTGFTFALPPAVLDSTSQPGQTVYRLKVQKQPGTLAIPLTIRIHLPAHASLNAVSMPSNRQGDNLLIETDLRTDVELELSFSLP